MRSILLAVVVSLVVVAPAFGQSSFAQLTGASGCVLQTGLAEYDEELDEETPPVDCARAGGLRDARAVFVSPDQKHVYVVSSGGAVTGSNGVAVFARDEAGVLTARSCVTATGGDGRVGSDGLCERADALRDARSLAFSADGRFVYVVAAGSNAVSWFSRDADSGALTQLGCIKHTYGFGERCFGGYAIDGAAGVAVSPDGRFVYVAAERSGAVSVFERDSETGALWQLGCVSDTGSDGQCVDGVALAGASSVLMAADGGDVYVTSALSASVVGLRRDAETGTLTPRTCLLADAPVGGPCTSVPSLVGARGGAITPDGRNLYVAGADENTLTTLVRDPATGALAGASCLQYGTPTREELIDPEEFYEDEDVERLPGCGRSSALSQPTSVSVSADGRTVFAAGGYSLTAFTRDAGTGALTQFGCAETYPTLRACGASRAIENATGLAASGDGRNLYVTSTTWNSVAVFSASVAIASSSARVARAGTIRVRLSCPRVSARTCAGDVRVAGARTARFRVAAGATRAVTLRVSRAATRRRAAIVVAHDARSRAADVRRRIALRR